MQRVWTDHTCSLSQYLLVKYSVNGSSRNKRSGGWRFVPMQGNRSLKVSNDPTAIVPIPLSTATTSSDDLSTARLPPMISQLPPLMLSQLPRAPLIMMCLPYRFVSPSQESEKLALKKPRPRQSLPKFTGRSNAVHEVIKYSGINSHDDAHRGRKNSLGFGAHINIAIDY